MTNYSTIKNTILSILFYKNIENELHIFYAIFQKIPIVESNTYIYEKLITLLKENSIPVFYKLFISFILSLSIDNVSKLQIISIFSNKWNDFEEPTDSYTKNFHSNNLNYSSEYLEEPKEILD